MWEFKFVLYVAVKVWKSANMEIEPALCVVVEENEPGNLEVWKVSLKQTGNLRIWKFGNLEVKSVLYLKQPRNQPRSNSSGILLWKNRYC